MYEVQSWVKLHSVLHSRMELGSDHLLMTMAMTCVSLARSGYLPADGLKRNLYHLHELIRY